MKDKYGDECKVGIFTQSYDSHMTPYPMVDLCQALHGVQVVSWCQDALQED